MKNNISIIIYAEKNIEKLPEVISALSSQNTSVPYELIICCDNKGPEITEDNLKVKDRVRLVLVKGSGASSLRNKGASEAHGEILVFIDAECMPAPGFIQNHYNNHVRSEKNTVLMGAVYYQDEGADLFEPRYARFGKYKKKPNKNPYRFAFFRTANFSIKESCFTDLGGFEEGVDEGEEDIEFGYKLYSSSADIRFELNIFCRIGRPFEGTDARDESELKFFKKNLSHDLAHAIISTGNVLVHQFYLDYIGEQLLRLEKLNITVNVRKRVKYEIRQTQDE